MLNLTRIYKHYTNIMWVGIARSVERLATDWTVGGSNPGGGGEIFRTRPERPWGPPSLLAMGTGSLSGVKRSERGADQPPHVSPRLMKVCDFSHTSRSALGPTQHPVQLVPDLSRG
jgi:hypothetical protein